jgi:hypothetical protein
MLLEARNWIALAPKHPEVAHLLHKCAIGYWGTAVMVHEDSLCAREFGALVDEVDVEPHWEVEGECGAVLVSLVKRDARLEEAMGELEWVKEVRYQEVPTHRLIVKMWEVVPCRFVVREIMRWGASVKRVERKSNKFGTLNKHAKFVVQVCFDVLVCIASLVFFG